MGIYIKGMEMTKDTSMMLLITPEGAVWELGDLEGKRAALHVGLIG